MIAITYPDPQTAEEAMKHVDWAVVDRQLDVIDACWMASQDGEVTVFPGSKQPVIKAELGGAFGLVLGAIFAVPVAGFVAGAAIGYRRGRHADQRFKDPFVESIRAQVAAGGSAIVVLYEDGPGTAQVGADLLRFGGTVQSSTLPSDQLLRIQHDLDREDGAT